MQKLANRRLKTQKPETNQSRYIFSLSTPPLHFFLIAPPFAVITSFLFFKEKKTIYSKFAARYHGERLIK
jgi:hypothetical protein